MTGLAERRALLADLVASPAGRSARAARRSKPEARPYFTDWPLLLSLFFFAGLIRVFVAAYSGPISHDAAAYYLPNARILVENGFGAWRDMSIYVPPLFSTLVALIQPVFRDLEISALAISIVSASAMVFPVYGFARFLFPNQLLVQRFSVLIACVHPFSIRYGVDARADALFALLFSLALWCALSIWKRPRVSIAAVFGLILGLAYLVRPEALGIAGLLGMGCLYEGWRRVRAKEGVASYAKAVALAGIVSIVTLIPSLATNMIVVHEKIGVWTLSPKAGALREYEKGVGDALGMLNADLTMTRHEEQMSQPGTMESYSLAQSLQDNPGGTLRSVGFNIYEFLRVFPPALGSLNCFFWLVGMVFYRRKHRPDGLWTVFTVFTFFGLILSLFYISRRFWLWLVPFTLPVCAAGAVVCVLSLYKWRRVPPTWVVLVSVLAMVPEGANRGFRGGNSWFSSPEKRLGLRIQEEFGAGQVFLSAKGRVAFYADGQNLILPGNGFDDIARHMELRGVRFLCVDEERMERRRAEFLAAVQADSRLVLVDGEDGGERRLRVYQFTP